MKDIHSFEPFWGEWYIKQVLGQGSYGTVYLAEKESYGEKYYSAIKHIPLPAKNEQVDDLVTEGLVTTVQDAQNYYAQMVNSLKSEIKLSYKLKGNTNIVSYEEHQIIERTDSLGFDIFIKMELLSSLPSRMKICPLTVSDVVHLGIDICEALTILKREHIIHRDIKPDNIFVNDGGDYKLGDFGVARTMDKTVSSMSVKGTFNYMAPEVAKGQDGSYSVDIYSLGLVMYRLLNYNRAPFLPLPPESVTYSQNEIAQKKRFDGEALPPPSLGPSELGEIVLRACEYCPEKRWESPKAMKTSLENLLNILDEKTLATVTSDMTAYPTITRRTNPTIPIYIRKLLEEPTEKPPEELTKKLPEEPTKKLPEELTKKLPEELTKKLPEEPTKKLPEELTEKLPEELTEKLPEELTEKLPEELTEKLPEEPTKKLPEEPTEKPPEELTEKLPEEPTKEPHKLLSKRTIAHWVNELKENKKIVALASLIVCVGIAGFALFWIIRSTDTAIIETTIDVSASPETAAEDKNLLSARSEYYTSTIEPTPSPLLEVATALPEPTVELIPEPTTEMLSEEKPVSELDMQFDSEETDELPVDLTLTPHQHALRHVAAQNPTCISSGNKEYWRCVECGMIFDSEEAVNEVSLGSVSLYALGHYYVNGVCKRCGKEDPSLSVIPVTGISIDGDANIVLTETGTKSLSITIYPANTTENWSVTWSSSDPRVASVSSSGLIRAVGPGYCTIYVTTNSGYQASCSITVNRD